MKSHLLLLRIVLEELGTRCCTSTSRDFKTITTRVEHEGMSFLTISLPQFCRDFEKSLDSGVVDSTRFIGYKKRGCLPVFLQGFTSLVFDSATGRMVNDPSVDAIQAVRQICLMFGKIKLPCTKYREAQAIQKYVDCEEQLRESDASLDYDHLDQFKRIATLAFGKVMSVVDRKIYEGDILPKHGPGATADRLFGNKKYDQTVWTERLEKIFPHGEFLFTSWSHFLDSPPIELLEPGAEIPVKVITVPKTLKTPRIIAVEPTCMQYTQQGISEVLVKEIERDDILSSFVGFSDQVPNQDMARKGSLNGEFATLDLSEASDRVSNQLVRALSCYFPWFSEGLDATRSRKARVPGYGVIRLAKFASMGSALCFPIEAMVFLTVVLCGIEDELMRPLTKRDLLDLRGKVRVYGDDIIVPVEYVRSVALNLRTFGFVMNEDKSFWTGKFRESCGKEYFNGEDVTVVRVREGFPTQRRHVPEIIATVSLRNRFYKSGYWATARYLDDLLEEIIPLPTILETSPGLGRHSFWSYETQKLCPYLHTPLVRAYVVSAKIPKSKSSGHGALLKWFLKRGDEPFADRDHLERAGRPDAVDIKLRWVPST